MIDTNKETDFEMPAPQIDNLLVKKPFEVVQIPEVDNLPASDGCVLTSSVLVSVSKEKTEHDSVDDDVETGMAAMAEEDAGNVESVSSDTNSGRIIHADVEETANGDTEESGDSAEEAGPEDVKEESVDDEESE